MLCDLDLHVPKEHVVFSWGQQIRGRSRWFGDLGPVGYLTASVSLIPIVVIPDLPFHPNQKRRIKASVLRVKSVSSASLMSSVAYAGLVS